MRGMNDTTAGLALIVACFGLSACASNQAADESSPKRVAPSAEYSSATDKTARYACPAGYVLRCETRRVGRIRFSSIGKDNIESCSCEYNVIPNQSPLPGVY
jgi:hypothetical protein